MKTIRLRAGRERSLLRHHPWVFDGAVDKGRADAGETVRIDGADGGFLAWGAYSPDSRIRVRAWSFDPDERIDPAFFERRIAAAVQTREGLAIASDGVRLVHGEADGLPGLVVDRYADTLVAQFGAAGVERWRDVIADALLRTTGCTRLYGWLRGDGDTTVTIREHDWKLTLDVGAATRPAPTSTSATTARASRNWCGSTAVHAC